MTRPAIREGLTGTVAQAVHEAEARVRGAVPAARRIYIEPGLFRATEGIG
ncbi:hypothetical protein [Rhodococcus opacus]|nr:hypothetical protein [Rhodococcus opacus]